MTVLCQACVRFLRKHGEWVKCRERSGARCSICRRNGIKTFTVDAPGQVPA